MLDRIAEAFSKPSTWRNGADDMIIALVWIVFVLVLYGGAMGILWVSDKIRKGR